ALATGVPVIGSDVAGLPEVVNDGENGFLRPVGDVDAMAAAAVELLRDEPRWQKMSQYAAADARERFSLDAIVSEYEAFYRYTLDQPSIVARKPDPNPRPSNP